MPRLSRWMVRAAFLHLAYGFLFGGLMLLQKAWPLYPQAMALLPWHIHAMLIGWTVQFAFGVAFWIFPRFALERPGDPRGRTGLAWAAFGLLNAGVVLAGAGAWIPLPAAAGLPFLGATLEAAGVGAFLIHLWPRIRPAVMGSP